MLISPIWDWLCKKGIVSFPFFHLVTLLSWILGVSRRVVGKGEGEGGGEGGRGKGEGGGDEGAGEVGDGIIEEGEGGLQGERERELQSKLERERARWAVERGILGERLKEEERMRRELRERLEGDIKRLQELVVRGEREIAMAEKIVEETRKRLEAQRLLESSLAPDALVSGLGTYGGAREEGGGGTGGVSTLSCGYVETYRRYQEIPSC